MGGSVGAPGSTSRQRLADSVNMSSFSHNSVFWAHAYEGRNHSGLKVFGSLFVCLNSNTYMVKTM